MVGIEPVELCLHKLHSFFLRDHAALVRIHYEQKILSGIGCSSEFLLSFSLRSWRNYSSRLLALRGGDACASPDERRSGDKPEKSWPVPEHAPPPSEIA